MNFMELSRVLSSACKAIQCDICSTISDDPVSIGCQHFFCRKCITVGLKGSNQAQCPKCMHKFTKRSIRAASQRKSIAAAVNSVVDSIELLFQAQNVGDDAKIQLALLKSGKQKVQQEASSALSSKNKLVENEDVVGEVQENEKSKDIEIEKVTVRTKHSSKLSSGRKRLRNVTKESSENVVNERPSKQMKVSRRNSQQTMMDHFLSKPVANDVKNISASSAKPHDEEESIQIVPHDYEDSNSEVSANKICSSDDSSKKTDSVRIQRRGKWRRKSHYKVPESTVSCLIQNVQEKCLISENCEDVDAGELPEQSDAERPSEISENGVCEILDHNKKDRFEYKNANRKNSTNKSNLRKTLAKEQSEIEEGDVIVLKNPNEDYVADITNCSTPNKTRKSTTPPRSPGWSRIKKLNKEFRTKCFRKLDVQKCKLSKSRAHLENAENDEQVEPKQLDDSRDEIATDDDDIEQQASLNSEGNDHQDLVSNGNHDMVAELEENGVAAHEDDNEIPAEKAVNVLQKSSSPRRFVPETQDEVAESKNDGKTTSRNNDELVDVPQIQENSIRLATPTEKDDSMQITETPYNREEIMEICEKASAEKIVIPTTGVNNFVNTDANANRVELGIQPFQSSNLDEQSTHTDLGHLETDERSKNSSNRMNMFASRVQRCENDVLPLCRVPLALPSPAEKPNVVKNVSMFFQQYRNNVENYLDGNKTPVTASPVAEERIYRNSNHACKTIEVFNSPEETVRRKRLSSGNTSGKIVKRLCFTQEEIDAYFQHYNESANTEVICSVPLLSSDLTMQVAISDGTLNISVLKSLQRQSMSIRDPDAGTKTPTVCCDRQFPSPKALNYCGNSESSHNVLLRKVMDSLASPKGDQSLTTARQNGTCLAMDQEKPIAAETTVNGHEVTTTSPAVTEDKGWSDATTIPWSTSLSCNKDRQEISNSKSASSPLDKTRGFNTILMDFSHTEKPLNLKNDVSLNAVNLSISKPGCDKDRQCGPSPNTSFAKSHLIVPATQPEMDKVSPLISDTYKLSEEIDPFESEELLENSELGTLDVGRNLKSSVPNVPVSSVAQPSKLSKTRSNLSKKQNKQLSEVSVDQKKQQDFKNPVIHRSFGEPGDVSSISLPNKRGAKNDLPYSSMGSLCSEDLCTEKLFEVRKEIENLDEQIKMYKDLVVDCSDAEDEEEGDDMLQELEGDPRNPYSGILEDSFAFSEDSDLFPAVPPTPQKRRK